MNPNSPSSADEPLPNSSAEPRARQIECLFQEHNDSLLRFLSARLGSHQEAKEIAQEAYVRLLSLDSSGVSYLRAFLFKTASNLAIDRLRARRSDERRASFDFFASSERALSAEREAAGREDIALLQRLLDELPLKCRRAFMLNRFHGMDIPSIAADLKTTERSVRRYITQALVHCRSGMDAAHGDIT